MNLGMVYNQNIIFKLNLSFLLVICLMAGTPFRAFSQGDEEGPILDIFSTFPFRSSGIAFSNDGQLFVSASGNGTVKHILSIGSQPTDTVCSLDCFAIQYLKLATDGSLRVSQVVERGKDNACLLKIKDGNVLKISDGYVQPVGISFDTHNNLYVVDAMLRKVFRLMEDGTKTVFIDLDQFPEAKDILYHGIDFNTTYKLLFVAGINIGGGTGNILMFRIDDNDSVSSPEVICRGNCKQIVTCGSKLYSTMNSDELIIKDFITDKTEIIRDPLLTNGMSLSFGENGPAGKTIYINTFDKIVRVRFHKPF